MTTASIDRRAITTLSLAHLSSDFVQGAVPALIPFLVLERGLSYTAAGTLLLAASLGSSIIQPLFGLFADRVAAAWLMPAGVAVGGVGIATVGLTSSYPLTLVLLAVGGVGVAAFHPEGARYANYVSRGRTATGMSLFSVGGNAGFALGPICVTALVVPLGLHATPALLAVPLVSAVLVASQLGHLTAFAPDADRAGGDRRAPGSAQWWPFARLAGAAVARTGVTFGLQAFIPLYFVTHFGTSEATGNAAVTAMLIAGAVGTLVGGRLADRLGHRAIVAGFLAALVPLAIALPFASLAVAFVLLALIGFVVDGNYSTTVVIGQGYLPGRVGLASGVTLGLSVGLGGLIASALGALADATSLTATLYAIAAFPAVALALVVSLPRPRVPTRSVAAVVPSP